MIAYIKGILETVLDESIVIDNNNIGYEIRIPSSSIASLKSIGDEIKIHTYLYVREDAMVLYGFLNEEELTIFKLLLTVNGIGPKGALGILSAITPDELRFAVMTDDDQTISKAPGIGKKTAQKLILDLKDKLKIKDYQDLVTKQVVSSMNNNIPSDSLNEAIQALMTLGYSQAEASKAAKSAKNYGTVEEILKQALKQLSKF